MNKIRKGDEVIVIAGRDKGKKGTVTAVIPSENMLLIDGINTVKKHTKPNPNNNDRGGIVMKSLPMRREKVMVYNSATQKGDRVGIRVLDDGRKVRYFKSTDEVVDVDV